MTRRSLALLWVSVVVAGVCSDAVAQSEPAQSWPTKPVRAVLPFAPGTGADIITRIELNQLSQQLGQSFVIENKGGAGGSLGTADPSSQQSSSTGGLLRGDIAPSALL